MGFLSGVMEMFRNEIGQGLHNAENVLKSTGLYALK